MHGAACQPKDGGGCESCPSVFNALIVECVGCGGRGCPSCNGRGKEEITACIRSNLTTDVMRMIRWVRRYKESRIMPEDGNGLSQTKSYLDSLDFIQGEFSFWERQRGIVDNG